ncbi:hypothetical protein DICVIV_11239 [Dictyocaulus viviparus]|uniref:Uncharacterized protein n=1 Tax=Dictyocaulus viviparus TaxID=29172 RepID=A0A0D8XGA2_DICVI|nr:hypothetical protein DICVIV_11239 [Dictyocaulus viviparus]
MTATQHFKTLSILTITQAKYSVTLSVVVERDQRKPPTKVGLRAEIETAAVPRSDGPAWGRSDYNHLLIDGIDNSVRKNSEEHERQKRRISIVCGATCAADLSSNSTRLEKWGPNIWFSFNDKNPTTNYGLTQQQAIDDF